LVIKQMMNATTRAGAGETTSANCIRKSAQLMGQLPSATGGTTALVVGQLPQWWDNSLCKWWDNTPTQKGALHYLRIETQKYKSY
jgi:hypothetical protein